MRPWLQPILDREGRRLTLAAWPEGSAALGDDVEHFADLLDDQALALSTPGLEAAVRGRLRPSSPVRTPAGSWMLALNDLLSR